MNGILAIDGSWLLTKSFYGNLPEMIKAEKDPERKKDLYELCDIAPDGKTYVNGIYPFFKTLTSILKYQQPSHLVIAFDKSRNTFRRELFSDYKGNRGEKPEPLKEQFRTIRDLLRELNVVVLESDTYEADDLIGTVAHRFENQLPVACMTVDHDYLQLASDNTTVWLHIPPSVKGGEADFSKLMSYYEYFGFSEEDRAEFPNGILPCTPDMVASLEGVMPEQIPDKKGISGDTADNIPGVKGVSSAAAPLLNRYGTLENLYAAIEMEGQNIENEWKEDMGIRKGNYKKFTAQGAKESALLSKRLATIVDVPDFSYELSDLEEHFDWNRYEELYRELGFDVFDAMYMAENENEMEERDY